MTGYNQIRSEFLNEKFFFQIQRELRINIQLLTRLIGNERISQALQTQNFISMLYHQGSKAGCREDPRRT